MATATLKNPNFHILKVKHIGATNTKPAKVRVSSELFKQSIAIPYTNDPGCISPAMETAEKYLSEKGFILIGHGEGNGHNYIIVDTFEPIK